MTLLMGFLVRNGIILQRNTLRYLLFGFAAQGHRAAAAGGGGHRLAVTFTSRSTTNPIRELSRATREIAAGNFDVRVSIKKDRVEEFGELQRNFNTMAAQLKSNEYLRKDFISNVSHELKTPLSIMNGYAQLLAEGGLTEGEEREYARLIADEAQRLTELTGNMLRLSRIDHREIQPRAETFPLGEQLRRAIVQLEPRWSAAGLEMDADIQDVDYTGDPELLYQIWTNLLDNAIKFSNPGGHIPRTPSAGGGADRRDGGGHGHRHGRADLLPDV